ncbi:mucin-1-like [Alosa alosa]|nr:mucin-1-like [Alosa alosa]
MIFSNGSVIANSTTQFEASEINSNIVTFEVNNAKSPLLLQESFTEVTEAISSKNGTNNETTESATTTGPMTTRVSPSQTINTTATTETASMQHSAGGNTSGRDTSVPGWGIALLVLAALILLILLIFLVFLVYFCCCRSGGRGFMNVSDPTPYMPFNPDIPMYSTHTTIDLPPNGKPYVDDNLKNRSGMYVVNPSVK